MPQSFAAIVETFLAEYFALLPVHATAAGNHEHDARWPDLSEAGRAERLAFFDRWEATLRALDDGALTDGGALTDDERIDRDLLLGEIDAARFEETELRTEAWDPLEWIYLMGGGIFPLVAREFAPLADRLASVAGRLEGVPAVVAAARDTLIGHGDRPVSRLHAETALKQLPGIVDLADQARAAADDEAARSDPAVAELRPRLAAAAETAKAALAEFEKHLRDIVLPTAEGEGRLGPELFAAKLRRTLRNPDLTPERVLASAERDFVTVRAELVRLAREAWPTWRPGMPQPNDDSAIVRGVLDAVASEHQRAEDLLDYCRAELARIEDFCRATDLVGLADEPLEIRWTPLYLRAFGGAMLDSPGPLDQGQKAFFSITPIPDEWSPDQAESYLREDNDRMLRLLTIHEAVPGHYLQGAYANRHPSIVRSVFWSGVFAEGWAVYVTQVMMDAGYGADDPALLLTHWKFYLRAVTNAIIDVRIHTMGMTEDEAVALMVDGGFQEEAEARQKYERARLTSTQLSTYYVGSLEFWELEREVRRRAAAASGDPRGGAAVPEPRVVGGFGDTPGFVYRRHLEACISHGSPPLTLLRRILLR
ncbi:MAG TPA: DUF885 domain-containing protein [Candidatus Limnocylindrales bacterium]|nr:DUF885 domain-containing protein [Candidatus Limnocylindrales bacterium]